MGGGERTNNVSKMDHMDEDRDTERSDTRGVVGLSEDFQSQSSGRGTESLKVSGMERDTSKRMRPGSLHKPE